MTEFPSRTEMRDSPTEQELLTERAAAARGPREGLVPSHTEGGHHPDRDTEKSEAQRPGLNYAKHCGMVPEEDLPAEKNSDTRGPGATPAPHSESDTDTGRNMGGGASDQRRALRHCPADAGSRIAGWSKPPPTLTIRKPCKGAMDTTSSQRSTSGDLRDQAADGRRNRYFPLTSYLTFQPCTAGAAVGRFVRAAAPALASRDE